MKTKLSDFITGIMVRAYMTLTLCSVLFTRTKKKPASSGKELKMRPHPEVSKA